MDRNQTLVTRVCPECCSRSFFEDPETGELGCRQCGAILLDGQLPDRGNDGYEQETHSATNSLHFDGALGTDMDKRTMYSLMVRKQVGTRGSRDLGLRYLELRNFLGEKDIGGQVIHAAQEYASKLLERCGLKYTPSSPNQESKFSHIIGDDLGRAINKFYGRMVGDLEALGYLPFLTIRHRVIVENLLALLLAREANLTNDTRRYYRVGPQLEKLNADLMQILVLHLYSRNHVNASIDIANDSKADSKPATAQSPCVR